MVAKSRKQQTVYQVHQEKIFLDKYSLPILSICLGPKTVPSLKIIYNKTKQNKKPKTEGCEEKDNKH